MESTVFVTSPRVEVISRPILDIRAIQRFLADNGKTWPEIERKGEPLDMGDVDGEWLTEFAARICYMSFGKGRSHEEHVKHLLEVMHGSTLEHAQYTLVFWNVSRSLTHELVRHRSGFGFSQLSQRYVDESDTRFVIPRAIQELGAQDPAWETRWREHMLNTRKFYSELVDRLMGMYADVEDKTERRKKARQAARSVLPNATETKIAVSANARAWRWLIQQRASAAAEVEIRALAVMVCRAMKEACPLPFFDMEVYLLPDGTEAVRSAYHKV